MPFADFYRGKRVLLTGHTGFKGAWLAEWLLTMDAEVYGYALDPQSHEQLFDILDLGPRLAWDVRADIRDRDRLQQTIDIIRPDIVFHLAAQPIVRLSYEIPISTFEVNTLGTAYLLDALRGIDYPCAVVCITTDKSYENREWPYSYREIDALGGYDPYSASKGCAEIIIASYRRSFFGPDHPVSVASARAGNVIGGGDWAPDRIVPDCFRAIKKGEAIPVRNKTATRPWQHVLEPLSGYLQLARTMATEHTPTISAMLGEGMNFGPTLASNKSVLKLVEELLRHAAGTWEDQSDPTALHEASKLNLAIDKAFHLLGWLPVWDFETTVEMTASWYIDQQQGVDAKHLCQSQIDSYARAACVSALPWAQESSENTSETTDDPSK